MTEPLSLIMSGRMSAEWADWMQGELTTDWRVSAWMEDDDPARLVELMADADVVVSGRMPPGGMPPAPNLKLYHIPFTGFDWLDRRQLPAGCRVCNTFEHETAIAEYVLAGMLEWEVGIAATDARFRSHGWEGRAPGVGPGRGELFGKTLGIVGYGHIGREAATRARAFGMRIEAVSRRPPAPDAVQPDHFAGMDDLDRLLGESDYVLVTLPLSDETRGLFDAGRFHAMSAEGVIINVGRGEVLDETALYNALSDRRIGGAVIDVWYQYPKRGEVDPPPSRHPFEDLDNVIMTPHSSARSEAMRTRRWTFVARNLDRFARGETLENVLFE